MPDYLAPAKPPYMVTVNQVNFPSDGGYFAHNDPPDCAEYTCSWANDCTYTAVLNRHPDEVPRCN